MPAFQPHPTDFIARLQNDGWKFAISYLIIFAIIIAVPIALCPCVGDEPTATQACQA